MLFAVLLSTLFGIFSHFSKVNSILSRELKRYEEKVTAQLILQRVFSNTEFSKSSRPYFYIEENDSQNPSLVFTMSNTHALNHELAQTVLAKLYMENNSLCLTIWQHPKVRSKDAPTTLQKDILLKNISSLKIELFKAPSAKENETGDHPTPPHGVWTSHWPLEYNMQPSLIRITCDNDHFYFLLPKRIDSVIYKRV